MKIYARHCLTALLVALVASMSVARKYELGDSPDCRFTMLFATKCLAAGASSYIAGFGRLTFPDSLEQVGPGLRCHCLGEPRKYIYQVSKDRQSFFLCCPVANQSRVSKLISKSLVVVDCRFGLASQKFVSHFPVSGWTGVSISDFLSFKFQEKFACRSFGRYRVLCVKNGASLITVLLNPDPMMHNLSAKFGLKSSYVLKRAEVQEIVRQNRVTEPSVIKDLYAHSK